MSGDIKEEDVLSLMARTGQDRERAVRALVLTSGDCKVALQMLTKGPYIHSALPTEDAEGGGSSQRRPVILETKGQGASEQEDEQGGEDVGVVRTEWNRPPRDGEKEKPPYQHIKYIKGTSNKKIPGPDPGKKKVHNDNEYLNLKVIRPLQETGQNEIIFRVRHTTQLGKLKRAYSDRIKVPLYFLRFLYDGRRITDEHTPEHLEMDPDDVVEVYDELGSTNSSGFHATAANIMDKGLNGGSSREGGSESSRKRSLSLRLSADKRAAEGCVITESLADAETSTKRPKINLEVVKEEESEYQEYVEDQEDGDEEEEVEEEGETTALIIQPPVKPSEEAENDLQRIKKKYELLVKKLRDKVECPVCLDVPKRAPIPVCPNGHVVCENCLRQECPTCRIRMNGGTSTLAVTVIENIEHLCEWEECTETYPLALLPQHMRTCCYRVVKCPGPECSDRFPLSRLLEHSVYCCVEGNEIPQYRMPHKFTYIMKRDLAAIRNTTRDLNWKLEGIKFDDKIFFLKVICERRMGPARWIFLVQMLGGEDRCAKYTLNLVVFKGSSELGGKYSKGYCGDVCPIDYSLTMEFEEKDMCLTMTDRAMEKILTKNEDTGNYEFSVMVNIYKS